MKEIWKDIEGYEGLYQISNKGRVKSFYNHNGKIFVKPNIDVWGYERVDLSKNKNEKHYKVHRLVAKAFIPNPNNYPCINHKDENKTNNCVDNLEWCSHKYNRNYGTCNDRLRKCFGKKVNQYSKDGIFIKQFNSISEACKELNYKSIAHISQCCKGKRKSAKGFTWKYAE